MASTKAINQRNYRARQRRGERVYHVTFRGKLVEHLIDIGFLTDAEADDPAAVALAIAWLAEATINQRIRQQ